ncbi:MAG: hypothetical protein IPK15_05320 [Verrucomicrobia bacterium]|nr:hypothetical protein [Verrucomicrobiota bacterium]
MKKSCLLLLAIASLASTSTTHAAPGDRVVSYDPGVGYTPNFTHPRVVLGEPSRVNPFGEATDPFNPAYGTNQVLSIGAGGSLVVRLQKPILNHPRNIDGLDFTIFGNSGFIITNEFDLTTYEWIGIPATDSSLFGESTGETRVSVSFNGKHFYTLNPAYNPTVDSFPPTDAAGDFRIPVDPKLSVENFAGATLEDIRDLYDGSGGGASYDISWAVDARGRRVWLPMVRYIRIDVISGKAEIDAFSAVARTPHWRKGKK